jgi:hypothetical protein
MLAELRAERDQIEEAIVTIQRLATGQGRRRGRPPAWMKATETDTGIPRKRKAFSAATRKKMAAAQRRRWAAKKAS